MPEALVCRRLRVHGVVQGVGFRWSTVEAARSIGASGWVRNLADGSVEILVWGQHEHVMRLLAWARRGPPQARVSRVEVEDEPLPDPLPEFGFRQLPQR